MSSPPSFEELRSIVDPLARSGTVEQIGDNEFIVTVEEDEEGGQFLVRKTGDRYEVISADNVITNEFALAPVARCAGPCSDDQHATVANAAISQVDHFSSANGPAGGVLACLWSVRHIVHDALGFWITRSDGTADFYPVLESCFGESWDLDAVKPGGLVISPTKKSNVGHIGVLGTGFGDERLIYSNSSAARGWRQNYNVGQWKARYSVRKKLEVFFFPLPLFA